MSHAFFHKNNIYSGTSPQTVKLFYLIDPLKKSNGDLN